MIGHRLRPIAFASAPLLFAAGAWAQVPVALSDKVTDLAGEWTRDPSRGTGGICGVAAGDTIVFAMVAAIDAGWLTLTMTQPRNGGFANVMQEVYILNRDRSELTVWRTLNTVRPDGSSGKIDCGNRAAIVYRRQPNAK
jgi:hypothetical protein